MHNGHPLYLGEFGLLELADLEGILVDGIGDTLGGGSCGREKMVHPVTSSSPPLAQFHLIPKSLSSPPGL